MKKANKNVPFMVLFTQWHKMPTVFTKRPYDSLIFMSALMLFAVREKAVHIRVSNFFPWTVFANYQNYKDIHSWYTILSETRGF